MADYTALAASIAHLTAKVDALLAKLPAPVDDQPTVDALASQVEAVVAKIPD